MGLFSIDEETEKLLRNLRQRVDALELSGAAHPPDELRKAAYVSGWTWERHDLVRKETPASEVLVLLLAHLGLRLRYEPATDAKAVLESTEPKVCVELTAAAQESAPRRRGTRQRKAAP